MEADCHRVGILGRVSTKPPGWGRVARLLTVIFLFLGVWAEERLCGSSQQKGVKNKGVAKFLFEQGEETGKGREEMPPRRGLRAGTGGRHRGGSPGSGGLPREVTFPRAGGRCALAAPGSLLGPRRLREHAAGQAWPM